MKNIQNTEKNLELFDKNGKKVYAYVQYSIDFSAEFIDDERGNQLNFKNSDGDWHESTYDERDNRLTFKNSNEYSFERTFDENNKELTYSDSRGVKRGFPIPEYTMEQLTAKLGENFKLIK